jgi:hypothetical protein
MGFGKGEASLSQNWKEKDRFLDASPLHDEYIKEEPLFQAAQYHEDRCKLIEEPFYPGQYFRDVHPR